MNFQKCYWFQMDALCSIWSHIAAIYDIVHVWLHLHICVPSNIDLICVLTLIFLCGLLSVSDDTVIASNQSPFI